MASSLARRVFALVAVTTIGLSIAAAPAWAVSHSSISGSGSSWAANAINQWVADVHNNQGLQIAFTPGGSASGRKDFANSTVDFGVSDIPYLGTDPSSGTSDTNNNRKFAYLPIVGGGTSFPYHLNGGPDAGGLFRNIRLSGPTLAGIFTGAIKYWDDPAILGDNNGQLKLPHTPIVPVVHSEGSGSTAQFTRYLSKEDSTIWQKFNGNDNMVEYYPVPSGSKIVAQNGSDGVMSFLTSASGNGAIAFDEYSYALNANYPVAKILNSAGYYTLPTQYNDAVALTLAQINNDPTSQDYLTQNLDAVYTNPDPRTYPISSYSYMLLPIGASDGKTSTTAARQTLADFTTYSICAGQAEMGPLGYSSLPLNLVKGGFAQIAKLKAADPNVDITSATPESCNNPTFDRSNPSLNRLAEIAPKPPACDQLGAGPCTATGNVSVVIKAVGSAGAGGTGAGGAAGGAGAGGTGAGATGATATTGTVAAAGSVDPVTGQTVAAGSGTGAGAEAAVGNPVDLANSSKTVDGVLGGLAVLLFLAFLIVPAALARRLGSSSGGAG